MAKLFEKIPDEFFNPLSRKYKTIYSYALICLYHLLKTHKSDIRRSEYVSMLKSQGDEILSLFDMNIDRLDDTDVDDTQEEVIDDDDKEALVGQKVNYIIRKLSACGWFIISKDPKTNVEYLYIPAYAIQFMRLLDEITSDTSSYLPLVHQTYAELKMEDEKEDDYMYRALMNARNNADNLELSVKLLRQQIYVFGNRLTHVLNPNEALKQHFDEYRIDISDKYYHPMKTFDSLGLYSQPTIAILKRWLKSERIITLLVKEAKNEPVNHDRRESDLVTEIIKSIQEVIDIFSRITDAFNDIDKANANYTEAVQRKVNYLSSTDKTAKGKVDKIILAMATEIRQNPNLEYEEMPTLAKAGDAVLLERQGFLDSRSLAMPFKRGAVDADLEPAPLDDPFDFSSDVATGFTSLLDTELDKYSNEAIAAFLDNAMGDRREIETTDIHLETKDELVLYILAVLKSLLGLIPFRAVKTSDRIDYAEYFMPCYHFSRVSLKGRKK